MLYNYATVIMSWQSGGNTESWSEVLFEADPLSIDVNTNCLHGQSLYTKRPSTKLAQHYSASEYQSQMMLLTINAAKCHSHRLTTVKYKLSQTEITIIHWHLHALSKRTEALMCRGHGGCPGPPPHRPPSACYWTSFWWDDRSKLRSHCKLTMNSEFLQVILLTYSEF